MAWLFVLSSARPPPTLLLSGMLIGGGGYMTAPSPLVPAGEAGEAGDVFSHTRKLLYYGRRAAVTATLHQAEHKN